MSSEKWSNPSVAHYFRTSTRDSAERYGYVFYLRNFGVGSSLLDSSHKEYLKQYGPDRFAKALNFPEAPESKGRILVVGYTSLTGSPDRNKVLARQRAQAVADYLQNTLKISADITISGNAMATQEWKTLEQEKLARTMGLLDKSVSASEIAAEDPMERKVEVISGFKMQIYNFKF